MSYKTSKYEQIIISSRISLEKGLVKIIIAIVIIILIIINTSFKSAISKYSYFDILFGKKNINVFFTK